MQQDRPGPDASEVSPPIVCAAVVSLLQLCCSPVASLLQPCCIPSTRPASRRQSRLPRPLSGADALFLARPRARRPLAADGEPVALAAPWVARVEGREGRGVQARHRTEPGGSAPAPALALADAGQHDSDEGDSEGVRERGGASDRDAGPGPGLGEPSQSQGPSRGASQSQGPSRGASQSQGPSMT